MLYDNDFGAFGDYMSQYSPWDAPMPANELSRFLEANILDGTQGSASVVDNLMRNYYPTYNATAAAPSGGILDALQGLTGGASGLMRTLSPLLNRGVELATSRGGMAGIAALLSAMDRQRPRGGGAATGYAGPQQLTRTMTQGRYGPIARYAASGGIVNAYAGGGLVQPFPMQDGGFVMTKRAVDGAGGPRGLQQRVPEAVLIEGPGHGTSDSIPAVIEGSNGVTPARVSNGEMYVPPGRDTGGLYSLMRSLERNAK